MIKIIRYLNQRDKNFKIVGSISHKLELSFKELIQELKKHAYTPSTGDLSKIFTPKDFICHNELKTYSSGHIYGIDELIIYFDESNKNGRFKHFLKALNLLKITDYKYKKYTWKDLGL